MEFIGEYLKTARVSKKYDISYVAEELKISKNILLNIENDNFSEYLNNVFLIGHLRSYAKFLNLDEKEVINRFKIQRSFNNNESNTEISKPIKTNNFAYLPKYISISSALIISVSFYFLFIKPNSLDLDYAITPNVPENMSSNLEKIEMNLILLNDDSEKLLQNKEIIIEQKIEDITSSSAIASLLNNNVYKKSLDINLKFLNSTWIQLRNTHDEIIFSKLMNTGDEYNYNSSQQLNLTAGNAGNIVVSLNGIVKGKVGKVGEIVDSIIIENIFNQ